jgi:hypothetical protein
MSEEEKARIVEEELIDSASRKFIHSQHTD